MLQRTTFSPAANRGISAGIPPITVDMPETLRRSVRNNPVGTLVQILSMPLDRSALLWWSLILGLFAAGAGVHIWLSIQITQAETELALLKAEHAQVELVNAELMWQISQHTSLPVVQDRADDLGFRMSFENRYVPVAGDLGPVILTTQPVVDALPTAQPVARTSIANMTSSTTGTTTGTTSGTTSGTTDTGLADQTEGGNRLIFGRLGISVQSADWVQNLRQQTGTFFADMNMGMNLLWQDLRLYGEQALRRVPGEFIPSDTIIASNR